ncbi:linker for activation of T-cells family member 2 [Sphaeramia orbicularis]|uniref:linker for activation of T-cells family member 2 n=1 Tax=Sphaeramia orbicularis TaxID=375764 RepID=UPI00117C4EFB|nr:linker for activation of T-cells family member 2-like [Sphaeramia orbicularis]
MLAAVLTVIPVVSLILLPLLCVQCKKKPKIINEEHQIYDPPIFQRGGSLFAVTSSKTVTRANKIPPATVESTEATDDVVPAADDQSEYQNITEAQAGSPEPTYVAPLPLSVYVNETKNKIVDADQGPGVYENIIISLPISDDGDEDDYENTAFLDQVVHQQDDNEPDYVNEDGT